MYYYFSASYPAIIKINGIYFGDIFSTTKFINIDTDNAFIEICPLKTSEKPVNFILDKNFINTFNKNVCITDMKGGYLIKFLSSNICEDFKVIAQQKFNNAIFSAFTENGYFLSVESPFDFYAENIEFAFDKAFFMPFESDKNFYLAVFEGEDTLINGYRITNKIEKVYTCVCSFFDKEKFIAITNFKDMAKHTQQSELKIKGQNIEENIIKVDCKKHLTPHNINPALVPFAFLENFLARDDFSLFLCERLSKNADKLRSYFLNFIGIMPPPFFRGENEVGLIYKKSQNNYFVDYFTFELSLGLISNIKKLDN